MYCDSGTLRAYEKNHHKWNGPRYTSTDKLEVKRVADTMSLWKNGVKLYTCRTKSTAKLFAKTSVHSHNRAGLITAKWAGAAAPGHTYNKYDVPGCH